MANGPIQSKKTEKIADLNKKKKVIRRGEFSQAKLNNNKMKS